MKAYEKLHMRVRLQITLQMTIVVKPFPIAYIDKSENVCYNTEKNRKGE